MRNKGQTRDVCVDILHPIEPLEGDVVGAESEGAPQQVVTEGIDHPPNG